MDFRKKLFFVLSVLLIAIALLSFYAFLVEPYWLQTDEFQFNAGLSTSVKFVLISDFHFANENYVKEIVREVNSIDADFILIAGDFASDKGQAAFDSIKLIPLLREFNKPVFAVLGNHDYGLAYPNDLPDFALADETEKILEENKINVLRNKAIELNSINPEFKGIELIGIDDLWAGKAKTEIINSFSANKFRIILTHEPETFRLIAERNQGIFGVAGHTHGGQAFPLTISAEAGFNNKSILYYVSRGIGTSTLPMRFLCRPEITEIELN